MDLNIHSIETFGTHEGPGLRFVIFVQGCNFRCLYCHNPDTQERVSKNRVASSMEYSNEELLKLIRNDRPYFGDNGGVTVSGGEPILQAKELTELFKQLKPHLTSPSQGEGRDEVPKEKRGIHTALDTNGSILNDDVKELLNYTDLVLLDIKHINPEWHDRIIQKPKYKRQIFECHLERSETQSRDLLQRMPSKISPPITSSRNDNSGHGNQNEIPSLVFLKYLKEINKPVWIRYVLVPGYTDQEEYLNELALTLRDFTNIERIEILPYHTLGKEKYEKLGWKYPLEGVEPPTVDNIEKAKKIFELSNKKVVIR